MARGARSGNQFHSPETPPVMSRARDALGQNRIALYWQPGVAEKRTMRRAAELVGLEMGRLGVGRLRANALGDGDACHENQQNKERTAEVHCGKLGTAGNAVGVESVGGIS